MALDAMDGQSHGARKGAQRKRVDFGGYYRDEENYPSVLCYVWLQLPLSSNCNYSAGKSNVQQFPFVHSG